MPNWTSWSGTTATGALRTTCARPLASSWFRMRKRWLGLGLLQLVACSLVEGEPCLDYGCVNAVQLAGEVPAMDTVSKVDALQCDGEHCVSAQVDVQASADACADARFTTGVCLARSGPNVLVHDMDESTSASPRRRLPLEAVGLRDRHRALG
jgi:hypothetical protein